MKKTLLSILFVGVICGSAFAQDTTPPVLLDFQILTPVVDTTSGPADAIARIEYEDDLSGAQLPGTTVRLPTGTSQSPGLSCIVVEQVGLRVTAECRRTLSALDPTGSWTIISVILQDAVPNIVSFSQVDLEALGFDTEFFHVGAGGDTTPPVLLDFQILTPVVDTTSGPADAIARIEYEDDLSGAQLPGTTVRLPTGTSQSPGLSCIVVEQVGLRVTAECRRTLSALDPTGSWTIISVILQDAVPNIVSFSQVDLEALGFDTEFFHVGAGGDTTPPVLLDFQILTPVVDTTSGPADAIARIEYEDDLSGAQLPGTTVRLPTGTSQSPGLSCIVVEQVGLRVTAECRRTLSALDPTGSWTIISVILQDAVPNIVSFSQVDLEALGFDTEFEVVFGPTDTDGDGVPDDQDQCIYSDLSSTVVIDSCESGVDNVLFDDGCTISDIIAELASSATNHGKCTSAVSHYTNDLKKDGIISGDDKESIQSCVGQADDGKKK